MCACDERVARDFCDVLELPCMISAVRCRMATASMRASSVSVGESEYGSAISDPA